MKNDVGVVIPALDNNRYSPLGDLLKFAGSTLLEWKIVQMLKMFEKGSIYVSTPSDKVISVAKELGVKIVKRSKGPDIEEMIIESAAQINCDHILWANPTSPFIGPRTYAEMINKYFSLDFHENDSLVAALKMQEFFVFKNTALNFNVKKSESRSEIEPLYKITNGCSIAPKKVNIEHRKDFGAKPALFEVDKFAAVEISEIDDFAVLNDLVSEYFRRDLDIVDRIMWKE